MFTCLKDKRVADSNVYLFGRRCHSKLNNNDGTIDTFLLHTGTVPVK